MVNLYSKVSPRNSTTYVTPNTKMQGGELPKKYKKNLRKASKSKSTKNRQKTLPNKWIKDAS